MREFFPAGSARAEDAGRDSRTSRLAAIRLRRQAVANRALHGADENVQLRKRGIDIWRHADALKLVVLDGHDEDAVLLPQVLGQLAGVDTLDVYVREAAGLIGVEAGQDADVLAPSSS